METDSCTIGIDIGGTTTSLGFVRRDGSILCRVTLPTLADQPAHDLVSRVCGTIAQQQAIHSSAVIRAIGIGAPNASYLHGTVESPVNLSWGASTNLVELFRQHYDLPVAVTNDANAAAIGELLFGAARGMSDIIVITLGTGLGSGIICSGELLYGADGFAGELGHTVVDPMGRHCACGNRGCLETYVSAPGICRTVFRMLGERRESSPLREIAFNGLTSRDVYQAAVGGDAIALAAFDETARLLAMKLADAVAHTRPEAIFLAGGMAAAGDLLLLPARAYLDLYLFKPYKGKIRLLCSELPEGSGAVLGAAALAWHEREKTP